jgi:hypothetical protein
VEPLDAIVTMFVRLCGVGLLVWAIWDIPYTKAVGIMIAMILMSITITEVEIPWLTL